MVSYMVKGNLQLFGEIQVTRYKDTRYEITLRQQPFYILYLVSAELCSACILYLFDKPKFTNQKGMPSCNVSDVTRKKQRSSTVRT